MLSLDGTMVVVWLAVAAGLIIVEALTFNLVSIWFALGALAALIAAKAGGGLNVQLALFVVVSGALLTATMPFVRKVLRQKGQPTNADRIIGAGGIVLKALDAVTGEGQIKTMGGVWSAKSEDGEKIAEGEKVEVVAIEGVKAVVRKKEEEK